LKENKGILLNLPIKNSLFVFSILFLIITLLTARDVLSAEKINHYRSQYKSALLADVESGRILFHDRMHQM